MMKPNNGNFLSLLELIVKFELFLCTHINQYGNKGTGHPSYLSKIIYEKVIQPVAKNVLEEIVKEIKEAGYFSVLVDSTPDVSSVDQLTVFVRYVSPFDEISVEQLLTFIELKNHTGEGMDELMLNFFEELEIIFSNCRGQSYDNAAGRYNDVQLKILEKNKFEKFIPYAGHFLNLVGRTAVDSRLYSV
uniref:Uncharacterized protein n=1 Tax=Octopus bimaculoides TaxID=37653 RepID=A0A0L8HQ46_OCTBM